MAKHHYVSSLLLILTTSVINNIRQSSILSSFLYKNIQVDMPNTTTTTTNVIIKNHNKSIIKNGRKNVKNNRSETTIVDERDDNNDDNYYVCPPSNKTIDSSYPIGFPQNLSYGQFRNEKGEPFITQDFWADIVDNKRTFLLRPEEDDFPSMDDLRNWIRTRPHPISFVINNNIDLSWPSDMKNKTAYELILNETNLHAVYAGNARKLTNHPKLKPIPIGLKWKWKKTQLFGESKNQLAVEYANLSSTSVQEVENLFRHNNNRSSTIFLRPTLNSNKRTKNYIRDTPALQMARHSIYDVLKANAPISVASVNGTLDKTSYFTELKKHRFVISPAGKGLDTHCTWEALLSGCIPIVPRSPLDSLFEKLPVWLIDSWDEVTDEAVKRMEEELLNTNKTYDWEMVFASGWKKEIYKGLCSIPT